MDREQTRVDHLDRFAPGLVVLDSPGASDLDHLRRCGEGRPGGSLDGLDSAPHPPPMTGIDPGGGWDVLPGQGLESTVQTLLVALDGEHVMTTLITDSLGSLHLGVHGVGGHHPVQVERLKQVPQGRDLVGLAGHPLLGQHGAGDLVSKAARR